MKTTNETSYSTRDFRRIFLAACTATLTTPPRRLIIGYTRPGPYRDGPESRGYVSGWAHYPCRPGMPSMAVKIRLPKDPKLLSRGDLGRVIEHELAHARGIKHADMAHDLRRCEQWPNLPEAAWMVGLPLGVAAPEPRGRSRSRRPPNPSCQWRHMAHRLHSRSPPSGSAARPRPGRGSPSGSGSSRPRSGSSRSTAA